MHRLIAPVGYLMFAVSLVGCAMCQSPFDYCSPTMGDGCCSPEGGFTYRRNSILGDGSGGPLAGSSTSAPTPAPPEKSQEKTPGPAVPTPSPSSTTANRRPGGNVRTASANRLDSDDEIVE